MSSSQNLLYERLLHALGTDTPVMETLNQIVATVSEFLDVEGGFLYLVDHKSDNLVLRAAATKEAHLYLRKYVDILLLVPGEGLTGWAFEKRETGIIHSNPTSDARFVEIPGLNEKAFQSALAVPIATDSGNNLGVLTLYSVNQNFFGIKKIKMVEEVIRVLAGTISRADRSARDNRKAEVLTFINEITNALTNQMSISDILSVVAEKASHIMLATRCLIAYQDDDNSLTVEATNGEVSHASDVLDESSIRAATLGEGNRFSVFDRNQDGLPSNLLLIQVEEVSGQLEIGNEHFGYIHCYRDYPFSEEEIEILATISSQTALSIRSALLTRDFNLTNPVWRFFNLLLSQNRPREIFAAASSIGFDIHASYVVVRGRFTDSLATGSGKTEDMDALMQKMGNTIQSWCPGSLVCFDFGELIALAKVRNDAGTHMIATKLEQVCSLAREGDHKSLSVGISTRFETLDRYPVAFRSALEVLKIGSKDLGHGHVYTYDRVASLVYSHRISADPRSIEDPLRSKFLVLVDYDKQSGMQLLETLRQYLKHHGNSTDACQTLRIHRNTLRQRLERVEDLTGIDLNQKESWFAYQIGIELARRLQ